MTGWPIGRGEATSANRGPSGSRPSGSTTIVPRPYAFPFAADRAIARACVRLAAGAGDDVDVAAGELHEDDRAVAGRGFEQRGGRLASEQIRQRRRIHDPPHDRHRRRRQGK